jgi:hypothetical protein
MAGRVYTQEERDAILARAMELHLHGGATSHDDLLAAAREVGVPAEAIERAAAEVLGRRRDEQELRELRARSWRGFLAHLVPYVMVSALVGFINVMTGGFPWALIVMLGWGVGLGSHLLAVAMPDPARLRRHLERERSRAQNRARIADDAGRKRVASSGPDEADEAEDSALQDEARRGIPRAP